MFFLPDKCFLISINLKGSQLNFTSTSSLANSSQVSAQMLVDEILNICLPHLESIKANNPTQNAFQSFEILLTEIKSICDQYKSIANVFDLTRVADLIDLIKILWLENEETNSTCCFNSLVNLFTKINKEFLNSIVIITKAY